jgi:hypothetical protein
MMEAVCPYPPTGNPEDHNLTVVKPSKHTVYTTYQGKIIAAFQLLSTNKYRLEAELMRRMRNETIITAIWYRELGRGEPGDLSRYSEGIRCWRAGVRFPARTIDFFSLPQCPDRPHSGYWGLFLRG